MDKSLLKTIELHMIANKIQDGMGEFIKGMTPAKVQGATPELTVNETTMGDSDKPSHKEIGDLQEPHGVLKKLGDDQTSKMIRGKNQKVHYEKLLSDGNKTTSTDEEKKLLSILDELDPQERHTVEKTISQNNHPTPLIPDRPVPVINTSFDETMFYEIEDDEDDTPSQEGDDQGLFEDDDAEDEDTQEAENNEKTVSLKDTDPGYFKSIVVKI